MSKEFILDAEIRTVSGKKVKQLRRVGLLPAVIYGLGTPENIQVKALQTQLALRDSAGNEIFTLNLNGTTRRVLAREVQKHAYRTDLVHIDFLEIDATSTIRTEVTVVIVGVSIPEQELLGTTLQVLQSIEIEALSGALISEIEVNAEIMDKPSRNLSVGDIVAPPGVTILTSPEVTIARFAGNRDEEEDEEEEEEGGALTTSAAVE
ncbi:MAG: large subunit ribosomal protein L25 [Cellvibrionaceae bacterium]|jgi:large subunit ribosomal protein L25